MIDLAACIACRARLPRESPPLLFLLLLPPPPPPPPPQPLPTTPTSTIATTTTTIATTTAVYSPDLSHHSPNPRATDRLGSCRLRTAVLNCLSAHGARSPRAPFAGWPPRLYSPGAPHCTVIAVADLAWSHSPNQSSPAQSSQTADCIDSRPHPAAPAARADS